MKKSHIAVLEQGHLIRDFCNKHFADNAHFFFFDGLKQFFKSIQQKNFFLDLILSDLSLDNGKVLEITNSKNNNIFSHAPTIFFSDKDDKELIKKALAKGAIDYFTIPFHENEVFVKIKYHLSSKKVLENSIQNMNFLLKEKTLQSLTVKELAILKLFFEKKDRTLSRKEICESIWSHQHVHPKSLDVHLFNLRKKLARENITIDSIEKCTWRITIR